LLFLYCYLPSFLFFSSWLSTFLQLFFSAFFLPVISLSSYVSSCSLDFGSYSKLSADLLRICQEHISKFIGLIHSRQPCSSRVQWAHAPSKAFNGAVRALTAEVGCLFNKCHWTLS
jgi:hypothetical protein